MAKTKGALIFATFVTSGVALVASFVALGTQAWIVAEIDLNIPAGDSNVNFGLFIGSYSRFIIAEIIYSLTVTCDFGQNKCAMLCGKLEQRNNFLQNLFDGDRTDGYRHCSTTRSWASVANKSVTRQLKGLNADGTLDGFIDSGVWLSTVLFLLISCIFGVIAAALAIWNTISNPVEVIFSTFGLYIYNGIACVCSLLVLLLWGVHFAVTLKDSVGIHDTITGNGHSAGQAGLGYSYWFNLVGFMGYGASVGILAFRQYQINKEPTNIVEINDPVNDAIILF